MKPGGFQPTLRNKSACRKCFLVVVKVIDDRVDELCWKKGQGRHDCIWEKGFRQRSPVHRARMKHTNNTSSLVQ